MITRIEALNYRCLRHVAQDLGPFHILVGPNGSGKSTFLDVLAFISQLTNIGMQPDGLRRVVEARVADYRELFWRKEGTEFALVLDARVPDDMQRHAHCLLGLDSEPGYDPGATPTAVCRYELGVGEKEGSRELTVTRERLSIRAERAGKVTTSDPILYRDQHGGTGYHPDAQDHLDLKAFVFHSGPQTSALASMPADEKHSPIAAWFKHALMTETCRMILRPEAMRGPCPPGSPRDLLPDGANLPWVVHRFQSEGRTEMWDYWIEHLRMALPDLEAVSTIEQPFDRSRFLVLKFRNGVEFSSYAISDGTLRMLALSLLPYLPDVRGVFLIEEPENGIHPTAVEVVFDSLKSVYDGQVLLATHSPAILGVAEVDKVLCFAKSKDGSVSVVPGNEHPELRHWHGEVDLGTLFASGVLG